MIFDQEANQHLQSSLFKREKMLWSGRPKQGIYLIASDVLGIPFSLLWGGFALFWFFGVISAGAPFFFLIFGAVFASIGLYFIFGRFVATSKRRANTFYAITDRRIIIKSGLFSTSIKTIDLKTLGVVEVNQHGNDEATIYFGNKPGLSHIQGMPKPNFSTSVPSFEYIKDGMRVYELLIDTQNNLRGSNNA